MRLFMDLLRSPYLGEWVLTEALVRDVVFHGDAVSFIHDHYLDVYYLISNYFSISRFR